MKKITTIILWASFCCYCCTPARKAAPATAQQPPTPVSVIISLQDTLLVNKYSTASKAKTCLQLESKIRSATYRDEHTAFNIGIADFEGDGIFNHLETDLLILTNPQNRHVRINYLYGTPHCPVGNELYIHVDGIHYLLSDIDPRGASVRVTRLNVLPAGKSTALSLSNALKGVQLTKYAGGTALLDSLYGGKPLLYVYFWDTHKLDYQMKRLDSIYTQFSDRVKIIGVHNKEHEYDKSTQDNFFELMAKPWNGYYCTEEQYIAMYQDYSIYRGLLLEPGGKIIYPHISPKELLDWLKQ